MRKLLWAAALYCAALVNTSWAIEAPPASADPALEKRMLAVAAELRCLVCQNETIAASNAELAIDLRNQVRQMLSKGQSEAEIIEYMTARYGDFVLYRPRLNEHTALLWFGPPLLMITGLIVLWRVLRRRSRLPADQFEEDDDIDAGASGAGGANPPRT